MGQFLLIVVALVALVALSSLFYWGLLQMLDIPGRERRLLERQTRRVANDLADRAAWAAMWKDDR
jgi:CHASE1-domain containing sensor protein